MKTSADYTAGYRARMKARGYARMDLYLPAELHDRVKRYVEKVLSEYKRDLTIPERRR